MKHLLPSIWSFVRSQTKTHTKAMDRSKQSNLKSSFKIASRSQPALALKVKHLCKPEKKKSRHDSSSETFL